MLYNRGGKVTIRLQGDIKTNEVTIRPYVNLLVALRPI